MKDIDLYQQVLGLSKPWQVREVKLELAVKRVTVVIECEDGVIWGDMRDVKRAHIHGWTKRQWRHLDCFAPPHGAHRFAAACGWLPRPSVPVSSRPSSKPKCPV